MNNKINIMIMSGVDDGSSTEYIAESGDGRVNGASWTVSIGRQDDNDLCLRYDTYVSRQHAFVHCRQDGWWLEDCDSTNGTYIDNPSNFFEDMPVKGTIKIEAGQLFRVGRTWLRIQVSAKSED